MSSGYNGLVELFHKDTSKPLPRSAWKDLPEVNVDHMDYKYVENCSNVPELRDMIRVLQSGKEGLYPELVKFCKDRLLALLPEKEKNKILMITREPTFSEEQEAKNDLAQWIQSMDSKPSETPSNHSIKEEKEYVDANDIFAGVETSVDSKLPNSERRFASKRKLPPVRNQAKGVEVHDEDGDNDWVEVKKSDIDPLTEDDHQPSSTKKLNAYDWDAWSRYAKNIDKELDKIDSESDKRDAEQQKRAEERARQRRKDKEKAYQRMLGVESGEEMESLPPQVRQLLGNRERVKGNEAFRANEFEKAHLAYSRSLAYVPKSHVVLSNRAMSCLKMSKNAEAEEDCTKALQIEPNYVKAISRRGMARHKQGKYKGAVEDFQLALKLEPKNKQLSKLIKRSKEKHMEVGGLDNNGKAIDVPMIQEKFTRVSIQEVDAEDEKVDSAPVSSSSGKGRRLAIAVDDSESDSDSEEEEDDDESGNNSGEVDAMKTKAASFFQEKDFESALKCFQKALSMTDDSDVRTCCSLWNNISLCYLQMENFTESKKTCDETLSAITSYQEKGKKSDAEKAKQLRLYQVKALLRRGYVLEQLGNYQGALDDMCKLMAINASEVSPEAGDKAAEGIERLMGMIENGKPASPSNKKMKKEKLESTVAAPIPTQTSTSDSILEEAERTKTEGNGYFKEKKFALAAQTYQKVILLLNKDGNGKELTTKKRMLCLLGALSNQSFAFIQLKAYEDAIRSCNTALNLITSDSIVPDSSKEGKSLQTKLYFRRGTAQLELKKFKQAKDDFTSCLALDPSNKPAKSAMNKVNQQLARARAAKHKKTDERTPKTVSKNNTSKPQQKQPKKETSSSDKKSVLKTKKHVVPSTPPKSSTELEKNLRALKKDTEATAEYLNLIKGDDIPSIVKEGLNDEIITMVIRGITAEFLPSNPSKAYDLLQGFAKARRFATAVMFLDASDTDALCTCFDFFVANKDDLPTGVDENIIEKLREKYI
eukprot:g67.t1